MESACDILVIGGGMAGLVAGITAAEMRADTIVVRKGEGATSMSSGAIDIAGYLRGASTPFLSSKEGFVAYSQIYPYHPYAYVRDENESGLEETIAWFSGLVKGTPAEVTGKSSKTIMALTVLGTRKPTCLLQKTMYSDKLDNDDEILLFVGIKGLPDFIPSAASKSMMDSVISRGAGPRKIIHTEIVCSPFQKEFNISTIELARFLETEEGLQRLIEELTKHVRQTDATLVALPPILGLKEPLKLRSILENETGAEIFELLSFPPSVPGYRLQRSLEDCLKKAGGKLLLGHEATKYKQDREVISSITLQSPRRTYEVYPKSIILSSGKFVGGGIHGDSKGLKETLFDLPVLDANHHPVDNTRPRNLTDVVPIQLQGHRLFECGIGTDESLHPIDRNGDVFAANLYAAGSILSGYNYPIEKSGLGVALTSGRASGTLAVQSLQGGR